MIRVCIAGVTGWMGRAVAEAVDAAPDLELVAGVSRSARFTSVADALDAAPADVLVEYTNASIAKCNALAAVDRRVHVVMGPSGLSDPDYEEIDRRARDRGVAVVSGNFTVTAGLLLRLAAEAARHLPAWEVIDYATAAKVESPSGTARDVAERLNGVRAPALGVPLAQTRGALEARGATVAGSQIHSLRLPSFTISTEVVFASDGERLSIRHDSSEKPAPYVAGTLLAIRSLQGQVGLIRGLDRLLS